MVYVGDSLKPAVATTLPASVRIVVPIGQTLAPTAGRVVATARTLEQSTPIFEPPFGQL